MGNHNYKADLFGDRRKSHFQQKKVIRFSDLTPAQQAFVLTHAPDAYALRIRLKMHTAKELYADEAYLPALFDCARADNPDFRFYKYFLKCRTKKIWKRLAQGGLPTEFDVFPLDKVHNKIPNPINREGVDLNMSEMAEIIANLSRTPEEHQAFKRFFFDGETAPEILRDTKITRRILIAGIERVRLFLKHILKTYDTRKNVFTRLRAMVETEEEYTFIKLRFFQGMGDRQLSSLFPQHGRHFFEVFFERVDPLLKKEFPE